MTQLAINLLLADFLTLAGALAAALGILFERRRRAVRRWRLLIPGVLAAIATLILIAYPEPQHILQIPFWVTAAAAALVGVGRGSVLPMYADHNWGLVRVRRTIDGVAFAAALVLFAALQTGLEIRAGAGSHLQPAVQFLMTVAGSFLLGRSVAGWFRAGLIHHDDLYEPALD